MFCKKCGTIIDDESTFCPNCGTAISEDTNINDNKQKISNKTIGFIVCGVIAIIAILAITTLIKFLNKESPEDVAKKYAEAHITGDYEMLLDYSVGNADFNTFLDSLTTAIVNDSNSEYLYEAYGTADISKIYEISRNKALETFVSKYGSDYKLEITTTKIRDYIENEYIEIIQNYNDDLESALSYLDDSQMEYTVADTISKMMINPNDVQAVCKLEAKATIIGQLSSDSTTTDIYCIKISNDWKVIECLSSYPFEHFENITDIY